MSRKHDMSRRALLRGLGAAGLVGAGFDPVASLLSGLIQGAGLQATARASADKVKNYVLVYLANGPARWAFDLPLHPYAAASSANFLPTKGVVTAFDAAGLPTYRTEQVSAGGETLWMPALWQATIPRPDGTSVPMASLLAHMCMFRGIDMGSDGHGTNAMKQVQPAPGGPSLHGLVADAASTPLPVIDGAATTYFTEAYRSQRGIGISTFNRNLTTANPLQQLLTPFQPDPVVTASPVYAKRQAMDDAIEHAIGAMAAAATAARPDAAGVFNDRQAARQLLKRSFGDLGDSYTKLVTKYRNLISRCLTRDIPHVNDKAVSPDKVPAVMRNVQLDGTPTILPALNADLRDVLPANAMPLVLAESFAVAEFMLTRGLTTAITTSMFPSKVFYQTSKTPTGTTLQYASDEHFNGVAISILVMAFHFRAVAACLYELVSVTKAAGMFDQTVMHMTSEFSRAPHSDGRGSDHGFQASVSSLISGAIKKPMVLGNIRINGSAAMPLATYPGTWGGGAAMTFGGTTGRLNVGHMTSTVADLLGVARPMPNFEGLLQVDDDGVTPLIELARNVEET